MAPASLSAAPTELPKIIDQEKDTTLPEFDAEDAYILGTALRERLRSIFPGVAALVSVSLPTGQPLFLAATYRGTTPDDHIWIQRKTNTALRFGCSSWYMSCKFTTQGKEKGFAEKYGLGPEEAGKYAIQGGAVPIWVENVESPVGVLVVSGLKADADHMAAIEGLRWLNNKMRKGEE